MNLDKIRGMLMGVFLGDALGAPHEFRSQSDIYTGKLEHRSKMSQRCGVRYMSVGQLTDDSEMTLTLARALIRDGGYERKNVILDYIDWANSGTAGIGINTQYLLKGIKAKEKRRRLQTYNNRYQARKEVERYGKKEKRGFGWEPEHWTQSNGSLMRCTPLSLVDPSFIVEDCSITNPHPVNIECNRIYILFIRHAADGMLPSEAFNHVASLIKDVCTRGEVIEMLSQVSNDYIHYIETGNLELSRNIKINKGWVLHSLYVAIMAFLLFKRLDQAIDWVIQLGGDTDTNAAIAGGLIGARLGWNNLLQEERTKENVDILLNADISTGDFPRDDRYLPHDFMLLTEELSQL